MRVRLPRVRSTIGQRMMVVALSRISWGRPGAMSSWYSTRTARRCRHPTGSTDRVVRHGEGEWKTMLRELEAKGGPWERGLGGIYLISISPGLDPSPWEVLA